MFTLSVIVMIIISVLLVLVVLVQPGKGDMISGMSGLGGTFSNMMGSRRAMDLLTKITIGLASAIMLLSLLVNKFVVGAEDNTVRPVIEQFQVPQSVPQNVPLTPQPQQSVETPAMQEVPATEAEVKEENKSE